MRRLVTFCALLLAACGERGYLEQLGAQGQITGAVLVARDGKVLLSRGYGMADAERAIPNTESTRFRIGSITKQFTALAILLLRDQGKLDLQGPVCSYLQSCPAAWQQVTIHELLTHSGGIADYTNFDDFPSLIGTPATIGDLIGRFAPKPLEFSPGARWSYSNSGYVVLGAVIENLSHQAYADFLQLNIFAPLGMAQTGYDSNSPPPGAHATGYLSPGVKPVYLDMTEFSAAGALYSTVGDLYLWDKALMDGKLASADSLQLMLSTQIGCPAGGCAQAIDLGYGYGEFIALEASRRYIYHWGRIDGFKSSNGFVPSSKVAVIVLSNLETVDTFGIGERLVQAALAGAAL